MSRRLFWAVAAMLPVFGVTALAGSRANRETCCDNCDCPPECAKNCPPDCCKGK